MQNDAKIKGLDDVYLAIKHHLNVSKHALLSSNRSVILHDARRILVAALYEQGISVPQIAELLGLSLSAIYKSIQTHKELCEVENNYREKFLAISSQLNQHYD